ncbi:MAG: hypothetical protein HPY50_20830 [Firmicutes bacterium]|nr:hypothetical protein [Bacillota bacterium]
MLKLDILGNDTLELEYLVLSYDGTLAEDGKMLEGVEERIRVLADTLKIYILTADTFGLVDSGCSRLPVEIVKISGTGGYGQKEGFVQKLGPDSVVAIGNGFNDHRMLEVSWLSILVMGREGAAARAVLNSDVVCRSIEDALDLLLHPQRLVATLRT